MHEGAAGIALQRLLEAFDAFLVVEAVAPVQPDIEPALRLVRGGGNGAAIGAEVEVIHALLLLVFRAGESRPSAQSVPKGG